jgi:type IV pilus assembly protein PilC
MSLNLSDFKTDKKPRKVDVTLNVNVFSKKINDKMKESFYRELGLLLNAGVDLKKAIEIISNQSKKVFEKKIFLEIKNKVEFGKSFSDCMKESGQFSTYEYHSIAIGEETRRLESILEILQLYFYRKIQMRRQIISVLTYPSIVLTVTFLVLYFMLNKVVPMFGNVFKQFGAELPTSTKIILKLSKHSGNGFIVLIVIIAIFVTTHYLFRKKIFYKKFTSNLILKIPYFGNLIKKIYLSRFCQAMHLLLASKTTLVNSLELTEKMIDFYPIASSIPMIKAGIIKGMSFNKTLANHDVYDRKMISIIEVSEQINLLEPIFEKLTIQFNEEISHETKLIGIILEPLVIIIIGLIVGIIMISMYAPMFDLTKIIK